MMFNFSENRRKSKDETAIIAKAATTADRGKKNSGNSARNKDKTMQSVSASISSANPVRFSGCQNFIVGWAVALIALA